MATNANKPGDNHDPHIGQPKLAPILEHVYGDENDENTNKITVNEAEREIRNIIQVDTTETNVDAIVKEKRRQSVDLFRKMLSEFRGNMIFPQANRKFSTDIVKLSDEDEKPRKDTKTGDKGAETYSVLCKRYKKVPINTVMRQFGKEVINLDGFDLSSKELKAFFVALLVGFPVIRVIVLFSGRSRPGLTKFDLCSCLLCLKQLLSIPINTTLAVLLINITSDVQFKAHIIMISMIKYFQQCWLSHHI